MNSPFSAITLIGSGILLVAAGFCHRLSNVHSWDFRTFQFLHALLRHHVKFFCYIWPLGTTPVAVLVLSITFISGRRTGLTAALIYIGIAVTERIVKIKTRRRRPFEDLPQAIIRQPIRPHDPSHPSGDAMRLWYLYFVLLSAFGFSWPVTAVACITALTVAMGRIALGVHYPLDVIGGTGLGILGAGLFWGANL